MKHEVIIRPNTAAVTTTSAAYDANGKPINGVDADLNATNCDSVLIYAVGLAGAESVTVNVPSSNGTLVPLVDPLSGVAVTLTATLPSHYIDGGPIYRIFKPVTVGAVAVECYMKPRSGP